MAVLDAVPRDIWFFSDPHVDHVKLTRRAGGPRPFDTVDQMRTTILGNLKAAVRPQDHVYCLGDFAMTDEGFEYLKELPGHVRFLLGNHDPSAVKRYVEVGIKKIFAYREFDGILFSHMPIAPWSAARWRANVHGHCHEARPLAYTEVNPQSPDGFQKPLQYFNISMENTNYRPVKLSDIQRWVR